MIENIINANTKAFIFAKDKDSRYLFCNEATAEAAGLDSPSQIVGLTDIDLFWHKYADLYQRNETSALLGKIFINEQVPWTHIKKDKATILTSYSILPDKHGYPAGLIGNSVDITGYTITKNNGHIDPEKNIFYLGSSFSNEYLTKREFEVFKYLLAAKSVEEIALILSRSAKTIQVQIKSIANKLQCSHKSEIVPTAIKYGLTHVLSDLSIVKK
ncbi:MAG: LuxR C-terminal-related transcriptional regulator [Gammaproteobacteria bacterium]|nr:LuxR C-terminal-related transcriptional regulator [Gammaproteobacteria bacterium]